MSDTLLWTVAGATVSAIAGSLAIHNRQRQATLENDRQEASRLLGWNYQALDSGFILQGRQIGRAWELVVSQDEVARWSTLTLGAPDVDRATLILKPRRSSLFVATNLPEIEVGSQRFTRRFAMFAADPSVAQAMLDAQLEEAMIQWPSTQGSTGSWIAHKLSELTIWVCPLGVRIALNRPLNAWPELQHMVSLGQTVALRSGLV
jgi:hypothetical protein